MFVRVLEFFAIWGTIDGTTWVGTVRVWFVDVSETVGVGEARRKVVDGAGEPI